jgi:hypothetical protein
MESIIDPDSEKVVGLLVEQGQELDVLTLAVGLWLRKADIEAQDLTPDPMQMDLTYLFGRMGAEEFISDLNRGMRMLMTESDLYIADQSLKVLCGYFDYSVAEHSLEFAAQDIGLSGEQFIEYAISGHRMLQQLPAMAQT